MSCLVIVRRCMLRKSSRNYEPVGRIPERSECMEEASCEDTREQDASSAVRVQSRVSFRTFSKAREYRVIMPGEKISIEDVNELEERLSEPTEGTTRALATLDGDVLVLGVGGKMGPTLARMAKRASEMAGVKRRVIGVSRFFSS